MIVCVCRHVSDVEILRMADQGAAFEEIRFLLGVASQCGKCESYARDIHAMAAPAGAPAARAVCGPPCPCPGSEPSAHPPLPIPLRAPCGLECPCAGPSLAG